MIARDSDRISIAGRVRQIQCPYDGFNSVRLMSIRVIEGQNPFYENSLFIKFTKIYSLEI